MKHKEIKQNMIDGVNSFSGLAHYIKNDDLRELIIIIQNNIKRDLKRGR